MTTLKDIEKESSMRLGHIIYTVHDLDRAVKEWEDKGFAVEYGRAKNPINALIYFSDGAYVELMERSGMSAFARRFMRLIGKGRFMDRFDYWENCPEGWSCLAIERDAGSLEKEIAYLRTVGIDGEYMKNLTRTDTKGRQLRYKCFFTHDYTMPFLMSYFETDPKPKNFIHPNGAVRVKKVVYRTGEKNAAAIKHPVQDNTLQVVTGSGSKIISVEFEGYTER